MKTQKRLHRMDAFRVFNLLKDVDTENETYENLVVLVRDKLQLETSKDTIRNVLTDGGLKHPKNKRVASGYSDRVQGLAMYVRDLYRSLGQEVPDGLTALCHRSGMPEDRVNTNGQTEKTVETSNVIHSMPEVTTKPPLVWREWHTPSSSGEYMRCKYSEGNRFVIYQRNGKHHAEYRLFDSGKFICTASAHECETAAELLHQRVDKS